MKLQRSIGLINLTFVAVSGVIGSGWLFAPLIGSKHAGPAVLLAWIIGAFAILIIALCFAEITSTLPVAGGIARLPHFTHGDITSMVIGWTAWVGYNTAAPLETIVLLSYIKIDFPWLFTTSSATENSLSLAGIVVTSVLLLFFVFINALGAHILAKTNTFITWFKLIIPIVIAVAFLNFRFDLDNFTSQGFAPYGLRGVFEAVAAGGIVFAFLGFRHAIDLAGETKNPQKTVPIALILSLLICLFIYLLLQGAFIGALSSEDLQHGWRNINFGQRLGPLAGIALSLGIGWITSTLYVGAILGPFGGALVATGSNARLGYALSQNKFFSAFFLQLSRRGIPVRMLVFNLLIGILMVIFMPFDEVLKLNSAAITLSLCSGPLVVFALRRQFPEMPRKFRLPALSLFANTGFFVATLIVYWSGWETSQRLGLAMLIGIVLFVITKIREKVAMKDLDLFAAIWLIPYITGLGLLSYLGSFGGLGIITFGWDILTALVLSVSVFYLAGWCRLPKEKAALYITEYGESQGEIPTDEPPI